MNKFVAAMVHEIAHPGLGVVSGPRARCRAAREEPSSGRPGCGNSFFSNGGDSSGMELQGEGEGEGDELTSGRHPPCSAPRAAADRNPVTPPGRRCHETRRSGAAGEAEGGARGRGLAR